jgi:hypothetical protein
VEPVPTEAGPRGKADAIDAPCQSDADCADTEVCEPGLCFFWCHVDDPDCCAPNACVPADPDPDNECEVDTDCGDGQWCQPGICLHWCSVDDPDCCEPNACVDAPTGA